MLADMFSEYPEKDLCWWVYKLYFMTVDFPSIYKRNSIEFFVEIPMLEIIFGFHDILGFKHPFFKHA